MQMYPYPLPPEWTTRPHHGGVPPISLGSLGSQCYIKTQPGAILVPPAREEEEQMPPMMGGGEPVKEICFEGLKT